MHCTGSSPTRHKVSLIHLKTSELELDFAEYIQQMCGLWIFVGAPIYHLPGNVTSAIVACPCVY